MIGIFDSGSGGLTVLKALREVLPSADVVYFGDIKNVPYGSKSPEALLELVVGGMQRLRERGATKLVFACNSVSASAALSLVDATGIDPVHIIEMVGPTVSYLKASDYRIALCATPATIRSGIYQSAFRLAGKEITAVSIPDLAPLIEFAAPPGEVEKAIADAFINIDLSACDVLVLACTHYPLATEHFVAVLPKHLVLFDPAVAVAERVSHLWWPQEVGGGTVRFMTSAASAPFSALVRRMFPGSAHAVEVLE